ncbi:7TM GPCR protein [Aphelenchoides avenae]|nr:7TM GPCR protein [Aphelenchus avenae]
MDGDGLCEIGSIPLPDSASWLISAVASFQQAYGEVHPFLAVVLCIAGTLMNIITVIVLTRPSMVSPVNVLLCAVAICDIVVMTSYLIFVCHFLLAAAGRCAATDYSYGWALFTMFHAHASVIFHATSIWLTVLLAQIRVLTIRRATSGPTTSISEPLTVVLALATCLVMTVVNLPNFLTFEIVEVPSQAFLPCLKQDDVSLSNVSMHLNGTTPYTVSSDGDESIAIAKLLLDEEDVGTVFTVRAHENDCMKLKMAFWSNGMIFKVVPCLLLTVSIAALLKIIADVSHKRKNLAQIMKKKVPRDNTTPMLVAVLTIFLIAELPQGLMLVLTGIFSSETFHKKIYLPLGDFMDLLSLLNSAIGFLIYVGMSRKFRSVFFQLFFSCIRCAVINEKTLAEPHDPADSNHATRSSSQRRRNANKHHKLQHSTSRFTTDNTRTEQLSYYNSKASTILSPFEDPRFYQPRRSGLLLSVDDALRRPSSAASRRSSRCSNNDLILPVPSLHNGAKRISFNLANNPICEEPISQIAATPVDAIAVTAQPSAGSGVKVKNTIVQDRSVNRRTSIVATLRNLVLDSESYNNATSSPQRRLTLLQAETNFAGIIY